MAAAAMSDIVEKTLTALPGLFLQNQSASGPAAAKASFSSRLGGLVRGITALTSKHVGVFRAGRSGAPGGGPLAGRLRSGGEPPGLAMRRVCLSVLASVRKRHFAAWTDSWEAGFPRLALTLTHYYLGQISLIFEPPCVS